jgi:dethiobiotin synthetase
VSRPATLIVVAGTGTEVGKTWVSARLLERLRADGLTVAARKPVQSFEAESPEPTDADVLAAATGEDPTDVCASHRWLAVPMAPPMAAEVLGTAPPTMGELLDELSWPAPPTAVGLLETVGGVRSPVADDGDSRDLARRLRPDLVVLVAHAGLGTIDSVRSAMDALQLPTVVHLNRFEPSDDLHRRNRRWLEDRDLFDVVTDVDGLVERVARHQLPPTR